MKKFVSSIALTLALLSMMACGGGTSTDIGNPITNQDELDAALISAKSSLATGDVSNARDWYTHIINEVSEVNAAASQNKASVEILNADEARVGRALCNLLLLPEKTTSATILHNFGQIPWDVDATVFDDETGFLARAWNRGNSRQADFSQLPFYNIGNCWDQRQDLLGYATIHGIPCLVSRVTAGYTVEDLAADLQTLSDGIIGDIITDLSIAVENAASSFTIPQALYTGNRDINLHHADITQLLAGMYAARASIDFANSYRFDIDLSTLVDEDGGDLITKNGLVNLLNRQFALRADHRLAQAENNLSLAFTYSVAARNEVIDGAENGILVMDGDNDVIFADLLAGAEAALDSLGGPTAISGIVPFIEADLENFFAAPFDGSDLEVEPFVVEDNHIRAVEAYWQEAINTALPDYNIGDSGDIFSAATRSISAPFTAVFLPLQDMRIGKWYVMND